MDENGQQIYMPSYQGLLFYSLSSAQWFLPYAKFSDHFELMSITLERKLLWKLNRVWTLNKRHVRTEVGIFVMSLKASRIRDHH